jgi:MYXO-CTERM domain-containing protein
MAPSTQPGETRKRTLHQDDIDGLLDLYGGPLAEHPMGCSTTGSAPTGTIGFGMTAIMLAGLMRRRRSSDPINAAADT